MPSEAAAVIMPVCVTIRMRRRSNMSARTPPRIPATNVGRKMQAGTSPTSRGEEVIEVMSQAAPTLCISVPTFENTVAIQRARNTGLASGAIRVLK